VIACCRSYSDLGDADELDPALDALK